MADEFEADRVELELENQMAGNTGTRLISQDDFDPELHKPVEISGEGELIVPEGYVLIWDSAVSSDTIRTLAETIVFNELTDPRLIKYVSEMALDETDFGNLDFIVKCYKYGQHVTSSTTMNYLGENIRAYMHHYVHCCANILLEHREDISRIMRGRQPVSCQHEIEYKLHQSIDNPKLSLPEKYAMMLAFSYVAEGLRKEGYDVRPAMMPQYLANMLRQKLAAKS